MIRAISTIAEGLIMAALFGTLALALFATDAKSAEKQVEIPVIQLPPLDDDTQVIGILPSTTCDPSAANFLPPAIDERAVSIVDALREDLLSSSAWLRSIVEFFIPSAGAAEIYIPKPPRSGFDWQTRLVWYGAHDAAGIFNKAALDMKYGGWRTLHVLAYYHSHEKIWKLWKAAENTNAFTQPILNNLTPLKIAKSREITARRELVDARCAVVKEFQKRYYRTCKLIAGSWRRAFANAGVGLQNRWISADANYTASLRTREAIEDIIRFGDKWKGIEPVAPPPPPKVDMRQTIVGVIPVDEIAAGAYAFAASEKGNGEQIGRAFYVIVRTGDSMKQIAENFSAAAGPSLSVSYSDSDFAFRIERLIGAGTFIMQTTEASHMRAFGLGWGFRTNDSVSMAARVDSGAGVASASDDSFSADNGPVHDPKTAFDCLRVVKDSPKVYTFHNDCALMRESVKIYVDAGWSSGESYGVQIRPHKDREDGIGPGGRGSYNSPVGKNAPSWVSYCAHFSYPGRQDEAGYKKCDGVALGMRALYTVEEVPPDPLPRSNFSNDCKDATGVISTRRCVEFLRYSRPIDGRARHDLSFSIHYHVDKSTQTTSIKISSDDPIEHGRMQCKMRGKEYSTEVYEVEARLSKVQPEGGAHFATATSLNLCSRVGLGDDEEQSCDYVDVEADVNAVYEEMEAAAASGEDYDSDPMVPLKVSDIRYWKSESRLEFDIPRQSTAGDIEFTARTIQSAVEDGDSSVLIWTGGGWNNEDFVFAANDPLAFQEGGAPGDKAVLNCEIRAEVDHSVRVISTVPKS